MLFMPDIPTLEHGMTLEFAKIRVFMYYPLLGHSDLKTKLINTHTEQSVTIK